MAAVGGAKLFRTGTKQVFLPRHVVKLLRPQETQPPQFATFQVPLTFNKFDLRDYLFHAYNVPVLGVRSQLRQQRVKRSDHHGRISRPPPVKTMTVELATPFVWPEEPEDKTPWNDKQMQAQIRMEEQRETYQKNMKRTGKVPLREDQPPELGRYKLREEARRLLRGKEDGKPVRWENKRPLDPRFKEDGKHKG